MRKIVFLWILLACPMAWGQGRAPEKETKSEDKHPVKTVKDNANNALDATDKGIHKALGAAKDGANEVLGAVDKGVHKVIGSEKK